MSLPQTIAAAKKSLDAGEVSAVELTKQALAQTGKWEQKIHAFVEVLEEEVLAQAKESDKRRKQGRVGVLEGIPIAVKDNICTTEGHTRAASKMLENFRSPYDATVVTKLKKEGAVIIGKANCDEFAMGASTEYSAYGPTKNPWDTSRVPGGSSGGSAAAVASGEVLAALGTDTGGSSRHPASFCGVVGMRPTYGRVSRFGAIAYGSSLDQICPITRTVEDAALMLSVMAGQDRRDATTSSTPVEAYHESLSTNMKGVRIGVPKEFFGEGIDPAVATIIHQALKTFEEQGAVLQEISLPLTPLGVPVYYLLAKAEGSTNLARYDSLRFGKQELAAASLIDRYKEARGQGFGPEVKRTILMGTYALSAGYADAWYKQAAKVRTLIRREYEAAFKEVDIIAGPTTIETAFKIGSKTGDPLQMYLTDALVVLQPLAGIPAISVPAGFVNNLPVGLQLAAPHFEEQRLFAAAHTYEQQHNFWQKFPEFTAAN
ncbi:MAG: Asp-tRNA(Asn)/Glu-tRNA(Gln) amidotransferase subunit GatA [Candidatus Andersenbacteria bacterium]|nr:Asp-tRNA(Asn)/Glu-tRNA(Gln) amidotransferase subunit GatA [Candidatus Andersenbacteria bacterium]